MLCLVAMRTRGTQGALEEFVTVGGARILKLWLSSYERDKNFFALKEIVKLCSHLPYNSQTKKAISSTGITKMIKRLSRAAELDEETQKCMTAWGTGNMSLKAMSLSRAQGGGEGGEGSLSAPPAVCAAAVSAAADLVLTEKLIADRRDEFLAQRRHGAERAERERAEERERLRAKHALDRASAPTLSRDVSFESLLSKKPSPRVFERDINISSSKLLSGSGQGLAKLPSPSAAGCGVTSFATARLLGAKPAGLTGEVGPPVSALEISEKTTKDADRRLSLRARAGAILKSQACKSILKRTAPAPSSSAGTGGAEQQRPAKRPRLRPRLTWADESSGAGELTATEVYELQPDRVFLRSCKDDKANKDEGCRRKREIVESLFAYQRGFQRENIMSSFTLKKNKYMWGLLPDDMERLAQETVKDVESDRRGECYKQRYVKSPDRLLQAERIGGAGVSEAVYPPAAGAEPQDPGTFCDLNGQPVYTSHTNKKSRAIHIVNDDTTQNGSSSNSLGNGNSVSDTPAITVTPVDVAGGAHDRMRYELLEKKTPFILMTYQVPADSEQFNAAGGEDFYPVEEEAGAGAAPGAALDCGVLETDQAFSASVDMDLDGISVHRDAGGECDGEEYDPEAADGEAEAEEMLPLQNLGPDMLNFLVNNEDKFSELCVDGAVDGSKADALAEAMRVYTSTMVYRAASLEEFDLSEIFDLFLKNNAKNDVAEKTFLDHVSVAEEQYRADMEEEAARAKPAAAGPSEKGRQRTIDDIVSVIKAAGDDGIFSAQVPAAYYTKFKSKLKWGDGSKIKLKELLLEHAQITTQVISKQLKYFYRVRAPKPSPKRSRCDERDNSSSPSGTSRGVSSKPKYVASIQRLCQFFNTSSGCKWGNECRYIHIAEGSYYGNNRTSNTSNDSSSSSRSSRY
jgi:hypothetical protein